jgi:hypothetical protein
MAPQMGKASLHKLTCMLEKIFSQTSSPISIKLDANYPFMEGIQVYFIKGQILIKGEIITKCK